jgi:hypothetical protein
MPRLHSGHRRATHLLSAVLVAFAILAAGVVYAVELARVMLLASYHP